jgi:hypothetical protein
LIDLTVIAIETAQQIVATILADSFRDWRSRRRISRQQLEQMATRAAGQARSLRLSDHDARVFAQHVLQEIQCLALAHPDLEWRAVALRPLRPLPPVRPRTPIADLEDAILEGQLERLDRIVAMRRLQLGLPVERDWGGRPSRPLSLPTSPAHGAATLRLPVEADWRARIEQGQRNVRARRDDGRGGRQDG